MSRASGGTPSRRRRGATVRIIVVLLVAVMLAGCGRKANPAPPPDKPSTYPRAYPNG